MSNTTRTTLQVRLAKAIAGIGRRLQNVPNLVLVGVTYTPSQAVQLFQSGLDSAQAVANAKARYQDAVKADRALKKNLLLALLDLQNLVRALFGNATDPLADFGFTPRKTNNKRTVATAAKAAGLARATREARHTMGKKQRLEVKGTLPVTPAPSPAPATPPVATPAGNPGSAPHA